VCVCLAVFILDIRLPFGLTCCCAKSTLGLVYLIRSLSPSLKPRLLSPWTRRSESVRSLQGQKIKIFYLGIMKKNCLFNETRIFLPQRIQHFDQRILRHRNLLICEILIEVIFLFTLARLIMDFYERNQFCLKQRFLKRIMLTINNFRRRHYELYFFCIRCTH
jgi:hypothetical protein